MLLTPSSSPGGRGGYARRRPWRGTPGAFYRGRASPFRSRSSGSNPPGRDILGGLVQKPLKIISHDSAPSMENIVIKDLQYLASYSWIESDRPTMIVPGSPRKWLNKQLPYEVPPDTGKTYVDQNGYRMPSSPLLPLFRAVDIMEEERNKPKLDWGSVDVVTDRNNFRKLLAWAGGSNEPFRIDIQLAGAWTVLFHRWEEYPSQSSDGSGFGDSFERESTAPAKGCEQSTLAGHHRIVTYDFAGLKLVLRFEVDAFDPSKCPTSVTDSENEESDTPYDPLDDLIQAVSSLAFDSTAALCSDESSNTNDSGLRIIRAGMEVPQEALIKVKTRSKWNIEYLDWDIIYPQLFIGQVPTMHIGVHSKGVFDEVRVKKLDAPELKRHAKEAQKGMKRLRHTLEEIHNFAMAHGKKARLSLVCRDGELQVMERESADSYLPREILMRFES